MKTNQKSMFQGAPAYETPAGREYGFTSEGVLCMSVPTQLEDYDVLDETDW